MFHITYYYTMPNSTNFTYSKNLQTNTQDVVMTTCYILINGLMSKGGAMHIVVTHSQAP
jgi:hypothetical protein